MPTSPQPVLCDVSGRSSLVIASTASRRRPREDDNSRGRLDAVVPPPRWRGGRSWNAYAIAATASEVQKDAAKQTGPLHRRAGQPLGVAVARQRIQQTIGGRVGRLAGVPVRRHRRKQPEKLELVAVELLEGVVQVQRRPGLRVVSVSTCDRGAGLRKTTTLAAASTRRGSVRSRKERGRRGRPWA